MARIWILVEYWLRSFVPWLASILLVVAVEDNVVQDPAHVVFIISKNFYNTKPTVILHFSALSPFWLKPTVVLQQFRGLTVAGNRCATSISTTLSSPTTATAASASSSTIHLRATLAPEEAEVCDAVFGDGP
jgi:hypothetical protein